VNILSAGSTNAGDIQIYSLPFVVLGDCPSIERFMEPPLDGETGSTSVDVTVADARGGVHGDPVNAPVLPGGRAITRRTWSASAAATSRTRWNAVAAASCASAATERWALPRATSSPEKPG
jgi:hypothetical protein